MSSSGSQGVPVLAPPLQIISSETLNMPLISCVSLAQLLILCSVEIWPRGYHVVSFQLHRCWTSLPQPLPLPCLQITMWQLVKAHRFTRNEPKIHDICYITMNTSSLLQQCPVHILFECFQRCEVKGCTATVWWNTAYRICFK